MWMHRFFGELELRCGRWDAATASSTPASPRRPVTGGPISSVCGHSLPLAAARWNGPKTTPPKLTRTATNTATLGSSSVPPGRAVRSPSCSTLLRWPSSTYCVGRRSSTRPGIGEPGLLPVVRARRGRGRGGQPRGGRTLADRLDERAATLDHPWARAAAARCRGTRRSAVASQGVRSRCLEKAVARIRSDRAPSRSHTPTGRWAPPMLAPASVVWPRRRFAKRTGFSVSSGHAWQERTKTSCGGLSAASARPDLTPAEEQVAELVAAGRTNREVAAQLFTTSRRSRRISPGSIARSAFAHARSWHAGTSTPTANNGGLDG